MELIGGFILFILVATALGHVLRNPGPSSNQWVSFLGPAPGAEQAAEPPPAWSEAISDAEGIVVEDGPVSQAAFSSEIDGVKLTAVYWQPEATEIGRVRVVAAADSPKKLTLEISQTPIVDIWEGAADDSWATGHVEFDRLFRIKGKNLDLARLWTSRTVRRRLIEAGRYDLSLKRRRVEARLRRMELLKAGELLSVMKAVAVVASQGRRLRGRWSVLARAVGGELEGDHEAWAPGEASRIVIERGGVTIVIEVRKSRPTALDPVEGLITSIRASLIHPDGEQFAIYRDRAPTDFRHLARLTDHDEHLGDALNLRANKSGTKLTRLTEQRCRLISDLDPLVVTSDGERVALKIGGVIVREAQLALAVDLVDQLAAPRTQGPYR